MIIALRLKLAMAVRVRHLLLAHPFDSDSAGRVVTRFVGGVERAQSLLARYESEARDPAVLTQLQSVTRELMRLLVRLDGIVRFWFRGRAEMMETWINARQIAWTPSAVEDALRDSRARDQYATRADPLVTG